MKTLKSISKHRPNEMLVDMPEADVKQILKTGEFIENTEKIIAPDESWTEKEIDVWLEKNHPEIKYYPSKHTKRFILEKINKIII